MYRYSETDNKRNIGAYEWGIEFTMPARNGYDSVKYIDNMYKHKTTRGLFFVLLTEMN